VVDNGEGGEAIVNLDRRPSSTHTVSDQRKIDDKDRRLRFKIIDYRLLPSAPAQAELFFDYLVDVFDEGGSVGDVGADDHLGHVALWAVGVDRDIVADLLTDPRVLHGGVKLGLADQSLSMDLGGFEAGDFLWAEDPVRVVIKLLPVRAPDRETQLGVITGLNVIRMISFDEVIASAVERHGEADDAELVLEGLMDFVEAAVQDPAVMAGVIEEADHPFGGTRFAQHRNVIHVDLKLSIGDLHDVVLAWGEGLACDETPEGCQTQEEQDSGEFSRDKHLSFLIPGFLRSGLEGSGEQEQQCGDESDGMSDHAERAEGFDDGKLDDDKPNGRQDDKGGGWEEDDPGFPLEWRRLARTEPEGSQEDDEVGDEGEGANGKIEPVSPAAVENFIATRARRAAGDAASGE